MWTCNKFPFPEADGYILIYPGHLEYVYACSSDEKIHYRQGSYAKDHTRVQVLAQKFVGFELDTGRGGLGEGPQKVISNSSTAVVVFGFLSLCFLLWKMEMQTSPTS